jgi:hypothetical protein
MNNQSWLIAAEALETLGGGAFGLPPSDEERYELKMEAQAACRREANRRVDE